jgi:hypothetical protein
MSKWYWFAFPWFMMLSIFQIPVGNFYAFLEKWLVICSFLVRLFYYHYCFCYTRGILWHLQKFLQYMIVEFTHPSIIFLYSPPPILSRSHLSIYKHVYTIFLPYSLSPPFPCILPLPLVPIPQTGPVLSFCSLFLKKLTILFV